MEAALHNGLGWLLEVTDSNEVEGFFFINAVLLRIFPYKVNDSTKCIKSREKKKQNDRTNFEIPSTGELKIIYTISSFTR